ncbi:Hypothetical predicted protein [Xyrichtys novacula]|uniref:Uncharacterized protein n=1 Tax=Xyrichtys novacula TaxID=13765 RepID=A0AAV1GX99_XYRNO|nr:Hypothetical predicted protein [Xyrichtys novacula]
MHISDRKQEGDPDRAEDQISACRFKSNGYVMLNIRRRGVQDEQKVLRLSQIVSTLSFNRNPPAVLLKKVPVTQDIHEIQNLSPLSLKSGIKADLFKQEPEL